MPAPIQGQSVEGALVKDLKTRLLLCVIKDALGRDIADFTFGSCALPIGLWVDVAWITLVLGSFLGSVPAVFTALFSGGFEGRILVALFLLLVQQLEGNVLLSRIVGSSVGVHPLLVLFCTLRGTLLFELWQEVPVVEVIVERALGVVASDERPAALRDHSAAGEG